ncbi:AAA family ATPase [Brevundimonas sp.]|uniref:AAA family ATPase n=1 Tax=Brevundimonas sp. TaxID=1871086 RepID=UPI003AFF878D
MTSPSLDDLFEPRQTLPDPAFKARYDRLVGLDEHKTRLVKTLGVLVNAQGLADWQRRHHPGATGLVDVVQRRPPLVVLEGDVGSGKTELAETIGDAVARHEQIDITLFPLSLATRGQGRVGEMTQLLSAAFTAVAAQATRLKSAGGRARGAVLMVVDEADALAQSRESAQMHHEDKAGVNAFIRGINRLANEGLPAAVIMCTNRLGALDPAVRRRAADILTFGRPNDVQRRFALQSLLGPLNWSEAQIGALVAATGPQSGRPDGFTFSDITQRLVPAIILDAYPATAISATRAVDLAQRMQPTPTFKEARQ